MNPEVPVRIPIRGMCLHIIDVYTSTRQSPRSIVTHMLLNRRSSIKKHMYVIPCFKRFEINHLLYCQNTQPPPVFILDAPGL